MVAGKDLEKRKRVMQRSIRLGHCICDPKQPCPCDVLKQQDCCPCAGERLETPAGPVRLTELVERPGCASKIDAASLRRVLDGLPVPDDPRVLVGMPAGDDAGVVMLDNGMALVQTVDVFAPSVDDPYTFGQIAAANSLSDVYAMGGRPISALSIVGFPIRTISDDVMHEMLRGGIDKMTEAGVPVVGGHSINEHEIKAGFAVTGLVDPDRIVTNAAARPGDRLILTKPLGTGMIAFAMQIGRCPDGAAEAAAKSMATLNRRAAELMIEFGVQSCTDVTGFGLMGHLSAMAAASKVDVEINWDDLPMLPGALQCAADGIFSGAVERNMESAGDCAEVDDGVQPAMLEICFDPQTSGGLLMAVPDSAVDELLARLRDTGHADVALIGTVLGEGTGRVHVRSEGRRALPAAREFDRLPVAAVETSTPAAACCPEMETSKMGSFESSCCSGGGDTSSDTPGDVAEIRGKFQEFMKATVAPGALDGRTKEAIAVALSILAKCEPCAKIHFKKAREMGFSEEEIDEAAWMAIAFGGSPIMMFYNSVRKS